ncbi:scm-like with four MBT domains protein 2 [Carlito syrichta]|uniref:Scm-like with four MBT domains protein 2 n=1 Tax=Carlito syrichta TaxID=1868482 RepID=A0A1U7SZK9_CARSF|nr:scm-like with four MBT domains protein 2 [Carlito syrichta]
MESGLSVSSMQDPSSSPSERHPGSANGNGDLDSEEGSSLEEIGFNWGEYLEETGASAAPHTSFKHVEISLQSNFQPGMKLEVANKNNPDTYWVATIITTCGQLLLLRYCGYGEDRRADFWCDVVIADLHPVGWCTQNNKVLMPPDGEPAFEGLYVQVVGWSSPGMPVSLQGQRDPFLGCISWRVQGGGKGRAFSGIRAGPDS